MGSSSAGRISQRKAGGELLTAGRHKPQLVFVMDWCFRCSKGWIKRGKTAVVDAGGGLGEENILECRSKDMKSKVQLRHLTALHLKWILLWTVKLSDSLSRICFCSYPGMSSSRETSAQHDKYHDTIYFKVTLRNWRWYMVLAVVLLNRSKCSVAHTDEFAHVCERNCANLGSI